MATIQQSRLVLGLFLLLCTTAVVHAGTYQLFADSRPESFSGCSGGSCNPFSSCYTWQNGDDVLANYPNGVGPINASRILTSSSYQSGFGFQYYLPWPSTDTSALQSGLLFSGHNRQEITFGSWFSVALLVHQNFPIRYASTQVCNKLSLTIPFSLSDSNGQSDSTSIPVSFTVEETPNDACNGVAGAYIYPKTSAIEGHPQAAGTYPPGWANAGLGVCPYGSDCTTTYTGSSSGACFGTLNVVTCPSGGGCNDRVEISGGYTDNHVFNLNGRQFFLAVVGFTSSSQYSPTDIPISTFTTVENSNNIGYLYARMIEICDNDLGCDDGINCTIDTCLSPSNPLNVWGYTNNFCYHSYSNDRCTNGCATGTCTAGGCNMNNPATTNTCPTLKCRSNSCLQSGATYACAPLSITPDPCMQTSNCAYGGVCSTDGNSCLCNAPPTTTTTTTTTTPKATTTTKITTTTTTVTTTTTTTTPLSIRDGIIPKLRCIDCNSNKNRCRVVFGYSVHGSLSSFQITDSTISILPNPTSNFINITSGSTTTTYVDLGQPGIFSVGADGFEIYSAGYFTIDLPAWPSTVTWVLDGLSSSVTAWTNACSSYSYCYQNFQGEIISSLCSWVETDSSSDLSFWYNFTVSNNPLCQGSGTPKVESLVIKMPRCTAGVTVLASAETQNCLSSRSPSPGSYITSSSTPDANIAADVCLFDSDDGNMGSPGWDAFDIPLNDLSAGKTCTIGVRIDTSVCPNIGYSTGGALTSNGRVSFVSNIECQGSTSSGCGAGNCNTWPVLSPIPTQCTNGYPSCSPSQYVKVDTCTCADCPACPIGKRLSTASADAGACNCIACTAPTCARNSKPDVSNLCNPCVDCTHSCACSISASTPTCPWRMNYDNNTCGNCILCLDQPNKTMTFTSTEQCTYTSCNPKCNPDTQITPNNACDSCIPCNATAVKSTCLANQTNDVHICYCKNCTRLTYAPKSGYTWETPGDLCDSDIVPCPACPANSSYPDSVEKCRYGATCVACPVANQCKTTSAPYKAPNATDLCSCVTCATCVNSTITSPGTSCDCTPCPDKNCLAATGKVGAVDCSNGCRYGNDTSGVNLCLDCQPCKNTTTCPANFTYGSNYCLGCTTPCIPKTCAANQVLKTPSDTCSTCVQCQSKVPSNPGYIGCPANQTLNTSTCQCAPCTPKDCPPPNYFNTNDNCASSCGSCTASKNCPANQTWDKVSYCNPCVVCELILNGGCGANQRFVASTQTNVCPTCENCTSSYPVCGTNTQRDSSNLCQCNACPKPVCQLGQYFDNNDYCGGCKNCTEVTCNPANQQYVGASYQICPSCRTCTSVSCSTGWKLNQSDICSGCFKCNPGVNIPACPTGQKPNPQNNCECIACVPLTAANCSSVWQTQVSNDTCATSCVPCDPGCDYNTTKPDPSTNGCTCTNCTSSGGGTGKHIGEDVQRVAHGTARDTVSEGCCPDLYLIPNYCQVIRGLPVGFGPYQCDCHNCTDFKECGANQRLVGCDCVDCTKPTCNSYNETLGESYCDPCVPCVEAVCGLNSTRDGVASLCDPCRECPEPQCSPNSRVNYTDLCSPCIPCDANKTVCDFGWKVDPADSCKCIECASTCGHGEERVSANPCDGCVPCPTDCPLNFTRPDVCQNCTPCEIPEPADSFQVNWTDVCQPTYPCLEAETAATCPGNWTVNASNLCQCIPCPEPVCGANQERASGDFCDGCTFCPDPDCPVNQTLKTGDFCDGCVPCEVQECSDNYQVDWSNLCSPCTYCNSQDTVCPVNFTVNPNSTCKCIECPDPKCFGDEKYASSNKCDGCVTCVPEVCETNFTRPVGLPLCDPCQPCEEPICGAGTQLTIVEGGCPWCAPCVPGSNVANCSFGWEVDTSDVCKCVQCEPPVCRTNFSAPANPCDPCVPCPPPECPKNQTVFDTCFGCVNCTTVCPIGTRYTDASDICQGCSPCPPPDCAFGFSLASDLCSCTRCEVTTCPSGFQLDADTGCGCNKCVDIVCPIGTLLTADGCNCETTTIYDEPNITTTRCNKTSRDYCGVCFGNNRTCIGCDGQVGGQRYIDACGVICGLGNTCPGCTGQTCNICTEKVDLCGVCGGNSTTCDGCDGVPASGAVYDICGVCAGNGTACLGCYGIPFGAPCPTGVTAGEAAAVSVLVALASLGCVALAMILWRMRSRPEILFQEWDNLIAEHLTEIQQNPLCTSNEPEVNPLFHHGGPHHP